MLGFGLTICFELKNGKKVTFDGSGFQEATTNYFWNGQASASALNSWPQLLRLRK